MPEATGDLAALARRVAEQAGPGEQVEVYVARGTETSVRVYQGEIESLASATSAGVGVRVIAGQRQGFAYAGTLDDDALAETLAEARDNVRFATPDPYVGLAEPDGVAPAALDLWDDAVLALPTDRKVELALELERRVRGADRRIRQVEAADYDDVAAEAAVVTSAGVVATSRRTVCSCSVSAIAGEGGDSQTGVGFSAGRSADGLDPDKAAADAVDRAVRMLGASKAPSGRCTVVFDPRVTSTLLAVVASAFSGEAVAKGRSFFAGRIGEPVAAPLLTLVDDPTDDRAFGATATDAEGLACRRNPLIEDGVLTMFVFDSTAGRRLGTASTASAVRGGYASIPTAGCRALALTPGSMSAEEVLAAVGDGLYVQSVTGVHSGVNPVSGDFSVGAEGLLIRGGELGPPVREITVASTLQRMLQSALHVGADVEWLPGLAAGQSLAVGDMSVSGS